MPSPAATPLVTPVDLFSWFVLAPLAVLVLLALRCVEDRRHEDAQRLVLIAIGICMVGIAGLLLWPPIGANAAWGAQ